MDDQFAADHAPGSMTVTASSWPTLVLEPEERPGWMAAPLAYALHLSGVEPLPPPGNEVLRGKRLEPVAVELLREAGHPKIRQQVRLRHKALSALAYPDGVAGLGGQLVGYEIKVVDARDYERDWTPAPLYPRLQAQCQMACGEHRLTLLVPLVVGYKTVELGEIVEEPRRDDVVDVLEVSARTFLDDLADGRLPAADDSASSYRALQAITSLNDEQIRMDDADAVARLQMWRDAQAAKKLAEGADAVIDRCKAWFAARAGGASKIAIGDTVLTRKHVAVKAHEVSASEYWRWSGLK